jgi:hypothetical protein
MPLTQLAPPYPIFTDKNGDPLDAGFLYFGVVNQNPETQPIQVYYDSAFTQPAAQPLRTSNGYVMRNGSPALIYADSQFSVTVRDKSGSLVIYSPVGYGIDPASVSGTVIYDDFTGDGVTTVFVLTASPSTKNATNVYIDGVYQSKDNYNTVGSTLTFSTAPPLNSAIEVVSQESSIIGGASSQQITYNQGGSGAVTRTVQSRLRDFVSVKDFGAVGDGVTDDTAAIQAAIDHCATAGRTVYFPAGTYNISAPLVLDNDVGSSRLVSEGRNRASIVKTTNTVGGADSVDAAIIIQRSVDYAYANVIDGISISTTQSSIAYGIYAPNISQCEFKNGSINLCDTGIYVEDGWLCSVENMNIAGGDTASPATSIRAGTIGIHWKRGTSLFCKNVWCRIIEDGFKFDITLNYSALVDCAVDYFTGTAYELVGSTMSFDGCGAEATVGSSAIVYDLNNSRASFNGCSTFAVAPASFFKLFLAEADIFNGRYDNTTSAGVGTTFNVKGGSQLRFAGRTYPTNTATVFDLDATSQLQIQTKDLGNRYYRYTGSAVEYGELPSLDGGIRPAGDMVLGFNNHLRVTNAGGTEDIIVIKSIVDLGVELRNANTAGVFLHNGGARRVVATNFNFTPVTDNALTLGSGSLRWSEVFATNGTINTSDAREKEQVRELSDAEKAVAVRLKGLIRAFKWTDAVETKGGAARTHVGVMAQDVRAAFEAEGLVAEEYGVFCYNEWDEQPEVLNEDGTVAQPHQPAGNRYGVRYDQLMAFIISAL